MNDVCTPPKSLRRRIALNIHSTGYQGSNKGMDLLCGNYWWPGFSTCMKEITRNCHPCQVVSKEHHTEPLKTEPLPIEPFQKVAVDFKGPLQDGYYVLVFMDLYSRWPEIYYTKSTKFEAVEKHLTRYFSTYGTPVNIKTDNGPPFNGDFFKRFAHKNEFKHRKLTPKRQQANGEVENYMKHVKKAIEISKIEKTDYKEEIINRLLADRATPHSTTGKSPYKIMFNRKIHIGHIKATRQDTPDCSENMHQEITEKVEERKSKSKYRFDSKNKVKEHVF